MSAAGFRYDRCSVTAACDHSDQNFNTKPHKPAFAIVNYLRRISHVAYHNIMASIKDAEDLKSTKRNHSEFTEQNDSGKLAARTVASLNICPGLTLDR